MILSAPIIFGLLILFAKITKRIPRAKNVVYKLSSYLQYSFYLRLFIEEFLPVFLISVLNLAEGPVNDWGERFSYALSIGFMVTSISLPVIISVYIMRGVHSKDSRKRLGKRLGSLFLDVKKDSHLRLLYTTLYVARRLIFSISIMYLREFPVL